ncbi:phage Gp37/Gp68 family protein [Reyranella sp.]|uniref:phage Gp37/Gp68 family protein n=1 Tax=Reyranella sp. TaxID=1929291 RepID=UPI003C7C438E
MADGSAIEWTSATWNPVAGCSILSPGCTHCYAMGMAARIEKMQAAQGKPTPYAGLTQPSKAGPVWNGRMAVASDETLTQPLRWKRPRRIFVNSMSDLFHEGVADETIDRIFAVMALCPQHTFQVLTKRAKRMREYFAERWQGTPAQRYKVGNQIFDMPAGGETGREHQVEAACEDILRLVPAMIDTDNDALWDAKGNLKIRQYKWPLPNVWLGVSTEDQARADERIPHLLATPAAKRFISAEPLLGAININDAMWAGEDDPTQNLNAEINWVIAGGESGPRARPMHPDWARSLRDQCTAAGVPFFFKQWGEWAPGSLFPASADGMLAGCRYGEFHRGDDEWVDDCLCSEGAHGAQMFRVGKKAAGAELDGKMHREFPGGST